MSDTTELTPLFECLVCAETHDGQPERVHRQLVVFCVLAEDISDTGGPSLPVEFGVIGGIGLYLLKLDTRRIGRLPQIVKDDVLALDSRC